MHLSQTIRKYLGWCPHGSTRKTSVFADPEFVNPAKTTVPSGQSVKPLDTPVPTGYRPEYQTNLLLILLFLGGLFSLTASTSSSRSAS